MLTRLKYFGPVVLVGALLLGAGAVIDDVVRWIAALARQAGAVPGFGRARRAALMAPIDPALKTRHWLRCLPPALSDRRQVTLAARCGRGGDCSPPPAQIPACGTTAPGFCLGS